jgi:uncharacterized membrane protein affecting hemolysin expression
MEMKNPKIIILILCLVIIGLLIGIVVIYKGRNRGDIRELEKLNKVLHKQNDSIEKVIKSLSLEVVQYDKVIDSIQNKRIKDSLLYEKNQKAIAVKLEHFKRLSIVERDSIINAFIRANQEPYRSRSGLPLRSFQ